MPRSLFIAVGTAFIIGVTDGAYRLGDRTTLPPAQEPPAQVALKRNLVFSYSADAGMKGIARTWPH